ncbi:MAG TPA: farnesyl diphosphate synthase [Lacunisphaera sp.]|nr:farnesyl diphosphate synthase [Lacunisphaera sp.]
MPFADQLNHLVRRVEDGLESLVPAATVRPARLHAAMRYSLQAGGKRLRPVLLLAATDLFDAPVDPLPAAVALECIHTYSLIHDDLPCMDDDDLRRGRPTAHRQFDEATALLAGDALLTLAFQLLARHYAARPALALGLTREFADAAGSEHLIGGQMEDLLAEGSAAPSADTLEFIHLNKTAAILTAALVAGGLCGRADDTALAALRRAGHHLGLAFQIVDDVLDATADTATLGKTAGKDARSGKTTYVRLHGLAASRRLAREHSDAARTALGALPGDKSFLHALIDSMATRAR